MVPAFAGPYSPAGDPLLRHDIQVLADFGILRGMTTTWPIAWGPVLKDIMEADIDTLPESVASAMTRVRERGRFETRADKWQPSVKLGFAEDRTRIRSFQNTPRGRFEFGLGVGYTSDWLAMDLALQAVDADDDELRFDDVMIGVMAGNWSISASSQQRWWGPGWDGSLILSNNARPIPSLVIDRVLTDAFESRWLDWLGPWDLNVMFGQLEEERHIPDAQFFGMRFNFRPLHSLEIGLSRTAQWCGEGRPCNASTFSDLLIGRDNRGDQGIESDNEPGNQLAGVDFRWSTKIGGQPVALYGQFIGEDEAGGFPSRWMGQFGAEWSGYFADRWSTRVFAEFAGTSCQFYESSEIFNCAYNHGTYRTGYRYEGRPIGHAVDNDARVVSLGLLAVDENDSQWRALVRIGELNRGGAQDSRNSLTAVPQDLLSIDISHSRVIAGTVIDVGLGYESVETLLSDSSVRLYLQWRSAY